MDTYEQYNRNDELVRKKIEDLMGDSDSRIGPISILDVIKELREAAYDEGYVDGYDCGSIELD